jgi:hypothetical protein
MRVLQILARALLRGPDADLIRHDLDELYARDRAGGVSGWRASARYGRRLAASALTVWREGRHAQQVEGARAPAWSADATLQDFRFALRLFRKHPGPVAIVVSGLALAIGAVTAVFSLVNASLLRPYAMDDPASVVRVIGPGHGNGWSYKRFLSMRDGVSQEVIRLEASRDVRVRVGSQPVDPGDDERTLLFVSGGYLQMLGGRPAVGRVLGPADDEPGSAAVVVVSHHFWQTVLAADPAVVGRGGRVNGGRVAHAGGGGCGVNGPGRAPPARGGALGA